MEKLFGLDMNLVAAALGSALAFVLALLAWRGRVMFRLDIRPVPCRSIFPLTPSAPCVKIVRRDGASSLIKPPPPLGFILAFIIRFVWKH